MPQAPTPPLAGTPPPFDMRAFVTEEATRQGVPPDLVHRMITQESAWDPTRISSKGAEGLMQLMPETARTLGVKNPFDPRENIIGGIKYLKKQLAEHKGDQRLALAAYNAGPANVARFRGVPPFPETQGYLTNILDKPEAIDPAQVTGQVETVDPDQVAVETVDPDQVAAPELTIAQKAATGATRITPEYGGVTNFLRAVPAAVGSFAGNVSKLGGPVGFAVGSALGGAGAAAGEAMTAGAEKLASMAGLTNVPPPTWEGFKSRVGEAALAGAAAEGLGRVVSPVASRLAGPFAKTVDAGGRQVQKAFPNALPNQVATSPILNTMVNVAEKAPITGGDVAARKAALEIAANQKALAAVQHYGGPITPENAGQAFLDALEGNTAAFRAESGKLYKAVDDLQPGETMVDLSSMADFADQELVKSAGIPGEVSGNTGIKMLKQVAAATTKEGEEEGAEQIGGRSIGEWRALAASGQGKQATDAANLLRAAGVETTEGAMAKEMTFEQAMNYHSRLARFVRTAKGNPDLDAARGTAQQLLKKLDDAMDVAGTSNPALKQAYETARTYYKSGKQKYESDLMRGLADQYPEGVVDALVKPGATTPIREARAVIGPKGWKAVQARVASELIDTSTKDGAIDGGTLLGKLRQLSPETLREVFPDGDHANALWALGRVLDRAQKPMHGLGVAAVYLTQSGVVAATLSGRLPSASYGILVTPYLLGKILTSKLGAKYLTTGLTAPRGSKLAASAMTKLLAQLAVDRDQQTAQPPPNPQVGQPPPSP